MRRIAGDTYLFQQGSAPAHRARETVQLQQLQETSQFICPDLSPPNSLDVNQIWGWMQERVYKTLVRDTNDLKNRLIDWKDTISGDHISPGSVETLVRRGEIANYRSIAYSLSNISVNNYQNRLMCVEAIVCNIGIVFWDTV